MEETNNVAPVAAVEKSKPMPIVKVRAGKISISVWANTQESGEVFKSCTIQKSFKDKEGNWKQTNFYNKSDLLEIAFACQEAYSKF